MGILANLVIYILVILINFSYYLRSLIYKTVLENKFLVVNVDVCFSLAHVTFFWSRMFLLILHNKKRHNPFFCLNSQHHISCNTSCCLGGSGIWLHVVEGMITTCRYFYWFLFCLVEMKCRGTLVTCFFSYQKNQGFFFFFNFF